MAKKKSLSTKVCAICDTEKPLSEFYKDGVMKGGTRYRPECKACYNQRRAKRKEAKELEQLDQQLNYGKDGKEHEQD
jgi:hypothetical protein